MDPFPPGIPAADLWSRIRAAVPSLGLTCGGGQGTSPIPAKEILSIDEAKLLGGRPADAAMAAAVRAGLLTRADLFHEAHQVSQDIATPTGSYWHGILHRREPDYGNARYWFDRVGSHPAFPELAAAVAAAAGASKPLAELTARGRWDAYRWIRLCEECADGDRADLREALERIEELEIAILLGFSYRMAMGKG
jgi:hypothetical protein